MVHWQQEEEHVRKKCKPLGMAAAVLMAVLALAGQAWAMYFPDGSVEVSAGVYDNPNDGFCVLGLGLPGTANAGELDVDPTISNQKDCIVATNPTIKALSQTACNGGAGNDGYRHTWATSVCVDGSGNPISRAGVDNTAAMCTSKGGTATGALCVAYGWQYMGAKASEAPYRDTINPAPADYKGRTDADDRGLLLHLDEDDLRSLYGIDVSFREQPVARLRRGR